MESLLASDPASSAFLEARMREAAEVLASQQGSQHQLAPGLELGPYVIEARLGAGGMGEVYRAKDKRLRRTVALKVLTPQLARSPGLQQRLEREATAISSLNHPHICTLYDIGRQDDIDYLVMEFLEGETLAQRLKRGALPLSELLEFAIQIAGALDAAHSKGVIHRDIKPANIFVVGRAQVKVLDFGLAKLKESTEGDKPGSTRTMQGETEEGAIIGTVGYMSPEQAQGKKVDGRSDIFSFGSVLYEMVTGRRAFHGDSKLSTLSAILKDEPKPVSSIVPHVPRDLERIIFHCLRKDPERRFQHMDDLKVALLDLKEESDSGGLSAPLPPVSRRTLVRYGLVAIGAFVALAGGIAGFWWWSARAREPSPRIELRQVTADTGLTSYPALSPDGKLLAYASDRAQEGNLDIWVQSLAGGQPIRLTRNAADDLEPSVSADGRLIAFRSEREGGGIYVVPTFGGGERMVCRGYSPRFSPDSKWIAYDSGHSLARSRIYIVPSSGGVPRELATEIPWAAYPVWSPDGSRIVFLGSLDPAGRGPDEWYVAPVEGGAAVRTGASSLFQREGVDLQELGDWLGDHVFFSLHGNLWQVRMSARKWQVTGGLQRLTTGSAQELYPVAAPRGSGTTLAFASVQTTTDLWSLSLEANTGRSHGEAQKMTQGGGSRIMPALSGDGQKLVYLLQAPASSEIRLKDLGSGKDTVLAVLDGRPKISPDGSKVAYTAFERNGSPIYLIPTSGGEAQMLCGDCGGQTFGWSPDGLKIVYWSGTPIRFSLLDIASRQKTELIGHAKYNIHGAELSPDSRWVAFHVPMGPQHEPVFVSPVKDGKAAGENEWISVSDHSVRNRRPWWSPDGRLLYFISTLDGFPCIWAQRLAPSTKHPWGEPLAVYHFHGARRTVPFDGLAWFGPAVSSDRIIFSISELTGNIWMAELQGQQ